MKWLFWIFLILYLVALALLAISTFGLFGQARDPLGGVFLLPLGLPWNLLADRMGIVSAAVVIIAPVVNLAILFGVWKMRSGRPTA